MANSEKKIDRFASATLAFLRGFLTVAFIIYIAYTLSFAVYKNYQTNQKIEGLKKDIATLEQDINDLQNLIVYYQTDSFRELEARRRLGMKGQGEEIIILPKNEDDAIIAKQNTGEMKAVSKQNETEEPNFKKWWDYIFK